MNRHLLLGSTAMVGIAALIAPVSAGSVGSKDAMRVTLGGELRFQVGFVDQDISAGRGRGYQLHVDESEIKIGARNTADNGIEYGVRIELNAGTDARAADEAWAFVDTDWGRIEMGDQDDAFDRMHEHGVEVLVGRAGADGDPADYFSFGGTAISGPGVSSTGDDTKLIYFSPRIAGFQFGASLTPDSGVNASGGAGPLTDTDNDGNFENVFAMAANFKETFDELAIVVSVGGEFGDSETASGAANEGDVETIGVGASIEYGAFAIGGSYVDLAEKGVANAVIAAGGDAGSYYDLGASYKSGAWGVSVGWFESEIGNASAAISDTKASILSFDAAYEVAPGWELSAALHMIDVENQTASATAVNNDGTVFIINNGFEF